MKIKRKYRSLQAIIDSGINYRVNLEDLLSIQVVIEVPLGFEKNQYTKKKFTVFEVFLFICSLVRSTTH